ncbi:hypothetical protein [Aliarcobacter butzleri]|uniref:hypothetical protein n=1 Tax=Aliarcobacter butzleri TaxID=28197 RepID=UPI00125F5982|nr:hypothetical protein [Aliarcobacter butzleri]
MSSCFVIMPIGDQEYNGKKISKNDLRERYDDLIKEALLKAKPDLEIRRADDIKSSGSISKDIFHRIIHSEYVLVDLTFPNPNVFYELGLRHATSNKTILIKEKNSINPPFDILDLRYIEYENTSTGLRLLTKELSQCINELDSTNHIDNEFLSYSLSQGLKFQKIDFESEKKVNAEKELFEMIFSNPDFLKSLDSDNKEDIINTFSKFNDIKKLASAIVDSEIHK